MSVPLQLFNLSLMGRVSAQLLSDLSRDFSLAPAGRLYDNDRVVQVPPATGMV